MTNKDTRSVSGEETEINSIGNYYGHLFVKKEGEKFYWAIENYNGMYYEKIPESLYKEIMNFQNSKTNQQTTHE